MTMPDWHMPWLLLIALQPMAIILLRILFERNNLNQYMQTNLQPWVRIQHNTQRINYSLIRNIGYWIAWLLFAIAAAGPRIAEDIPGGVLSHHGNDIMVVLDVSQSMHATDIKPSRLRQAHNKINLLINEFPNSRIGLIVYAAKPHLYVPLTHDKNALKFYLRNLDSLVLPSQGTRPSLAFELANKEFTNAELLDAQRGQSILHITDADTETKENHAIESISARLTEQQTPIYTLLMASDKGEAIPAFTDGWLSIEGRAVISRPNISFHQQFSKKTGGDFARAFSNNSGVNALIESIKTNHHLFPTNNSQDQSNWHELFSPFLLFGILFLMLSMSPYKLTANYKLTTPISTKVSSWFILCILLSTITSTDVSANQTNTLQDAYQALSNENFITARQLYASLNNFSGSYGAAVASYRMADYPRAIRLFEQAALIAQSDDNYTHALYNLGNSYFQIGNFKNAITSYQGALLYNPSHSASQHNLAYTQRALLAVDERQKSLIATTRAGRGPRSARAVDNIILNENNSISLDESESSSETQNSYANAEFNIPEFIILKGLSFADKSVENKINTNNRDKETLSSIAINQQLNKIHDNQAALWQRIFELEEGYPAPLEQPEHIPGVLPW